MIFCTRYVQARNQLGTPEGEILRGAQNLCPIVLNYV